jgi:mRNA degradation ribonuclease J1/J2
MRDAGEVVQFIKDKTKELFGKHYDEKKREQSEKAVERGLARSLYEVIQREPMIEVEIIDC